MGAPFGLPWSTFAAFIVVAASIVLSIVWSAVAGRRGGRAGDE